jgi:hypothetical protein
VGRRTNSGKNNCGKKRSIKQIYSREKFKFEMKNNLTEIKATNYTNKK